MELRLRQERKRGRKTSEGAERQVGREPGAEQGSVGENLGRGSRWKGRGGQQREG